MSGGDSFVRYSDEFERLMDEYGSRCENMSHVTDDDVVRFLCEMLPTEKFLKERFSLGCRESLWNVRSEETERFPDNVNIRVFRHFRYDIHQPHMFDYFQLFYVYSGSASLFIYTNEPREVKFTKGDFLLLTPRTKQNLRVWCDDCMVIKIYIRSSTFERTFCKWIGENNLLSELFRRAIYGNMTGNCLIFHSGEDDALRQRVISLYAEDLSRDEYSGIIEECILTEIFCRLSRDHMSDIHDEAEGDFGFRDIGTAIKYINDNRATVTLDSLSRQMGYSKNYFCRMLMKKTGRTFLQILFAARIEAAKKLLADTDMPIGEISVTAGFSNTKQFYRAFRKELGTTPGAYREKVNKNA